MKIDIGKVSQSKEFIRLLKAHDMLKEHPYRNNFSPMWESQYKYLLYELSGAWGAFIIYSNVSEQERSLLRKFGDWIHNYNASLLCGVKLELIPYYEAIISMTHYFLETGDLSVYYYLEGRLGSYTYIKYYLVTAELCGIDSPELPRYLPQSQLLCEDEQKIRERIVKYNIKFLTDAQIDEQVLLWKQMLLPIIKWHNNNLINAQMIVPEYGTGRVLHAPTMRVEELKEAPVYKSM